MVTRRAEDIATALDARDVLVGLGRVALTAAGEEETQGEREDHAGVHAP